MTVTSEPTSVLHVALAAHDAGLSVIPIRDDGTKKPALPWKQYQSERADRQTVRAWFAPGRHRAIGVVCGQVSGWLTMLEMEGWAYDAGFWEHFKQRTEAGLGKQRWSEIVRYVELSPSGGPHIYFRCPGVHVGNLKLARGLDDDGELVVMMETRGEGGYSVIAGSEGHPTGNPWRVATEGSLDDICEVTEAELDLIFQAARSLDQSPEVETGGVQAPDSLGVEREGVSLSSGGAEEVPHSSAPSSTPSTTTGTTWMSETIAEFNESVGILGVLSWLPGWTYVKTDTYQGESVHRIRRDGSDNDHGAIVFESGRIAFFSSNCPTWANAYDGTTPETYDPFTVKMWVDHGTNDTAARVAVARDLRAQGFGPAMSDVRGLPDAEQRHSDESSVDPDTGETEPSEPSLIFWADDDTNEPPEVDHLVTNLVSRGDLTVIGAPRALGKTWATMQLADICTRGDGRMFGAEQLTATAPATVVYLQGELGRRGSFDRWRLATGGNPPHVAEVFERLQVKVTSTRVTSVEDGMTLADEYQRAIVDHRLEPLLEAVEADLLIIDPWATYYSGDENSNDQTEAAIDALTQMIRRVGCAGWIVHHITNKTTHGNGAEPEDLWRGASRLADAVATRVTMLPHYSPARVKELGLDRFEARRFADVHIMQRNGPPIPVLHTQRQGFTWEAWEGDDEESKVGRPEAIHDRDVTRALNALGGAANISRIAGWLDVSRPTVVRRMDRLMALGVVTEQAGERGSKLFVLTGDGVP